MATDSGELHDVCIVGAGPAGLNAALILGRCRRDVVVIDSGKPRNGASRALHGFLSRDGTPPLELRALGRAELEPYPSVQLRQNTAVVAARRGENRFDLTLADGSTVAARILLLATGRIDLVPEKPGFREYYGLGVFHCPYCDGWEHRDETLVAYSSGETGHDLALDLRVWSRDVVLCTDGPSGLTPAQLRKLALNGVRVIEAPVVGARGGTGGVIASIVFEGHPELSCGAIFFSSDCLQKSPLAEELGCDLDDTGSVRCTGHAATQVPGLYVAGNVRGGVHLAIVAAAEGAEAGMAINNALHEADLK
ncbi:NAD(P)/FAD-dependent oxidoreductase [Opitutus terrae]|uniref:NAD(P)/FAD-dependent oxidoreductase n=1 Tax=Opitutus terrae TaxID=107709 RepID=UPI0005D12562|nr:NAD(P)/FAD-dependent oxidoreductase [Opitutus terrae]